MKQLFLAGLALTLGMLALAEPAHATGKKFRGRSAGFYRRTPARFHGPAFYRKSFYYKKPTYYRYRFSGYRRFRAPYRYPYGFKYGYRRGFKKSYRKSFYYYRGYRYSR